MTKDEAEKQRSLALAELMEWQLEPDILSDDGYPYLKYDPANPICLSHLSPYKHSVCSKAQFAIILLKFPEVMVNLCESVKLTTKGYDEWADGDCQFPAPDYERDVVISLKCEPTQANILDEILAINGLWQEEWSRCDEC